MVLKITVKIQRKFWLNMQVTGNTKQILIKKKSTFLKCTLDLNILRREATITAPQYITLGHSSRGFALSALNAVCSTALS